MDTSSSARLEDLSQDIKEFSKISKDIAADAVEFVTGNAADWERRLEEKVRNYPIQSLLIAAGIGIVLGAVWKRR